jgi:hypothetical protein
LVCYTTAEEGLSEIKYSDVLMLADRPVFTRSSGMVQALERAGFPVTVVNEGDAGAIADVANCSGPDSIVAASVNDVRGLEKSIVVYVDNGLGNTWGRLHAISRSTASLLWIRKPPT